MSRFLFVVPPLAGHVGAPVSVARELVSRGHEVAWALHESVVGRLLPEGATVYPLSEELPAEADRLRADAVSTNWLTNLKFFWEELVPRLCSNMLPGVEQAVEEFRPDAVVADQHALAGAFAARRAGLPWATTSISMQAFEQTLDRVPKIRDWVAGINARMQEDAGLEPIEAPDRSPHLVLVFLTRELLGPVEAPPHYRFVGPAVTGRAQDVPFPWEELAVGTRILVSLGTGVYERRPFLEALFEAIDGTGIQAIVAAPANEVPPSTANVLARGWLPQLALLEQVDAVVSHGGLSTICEALAHGKPLVVAPASFDHGYWADMVAAAGAGVRVGLRRAAAGEIRNALDSVLDDESYRRAAQRISASFEAAGGAGAAADALEELAG